VNGDSEEESRVWWWAPLVGTHYQDGQFDARVREPVPGRVFGGLVEAEVDTGNSWYKTKACKNGQEARWERTVRRSVRRRGLLVLSGAPTTGARRRD
jgi:hypothetical protein